MKTFQLIIYTPFGKYMDKQVEFVQVTSEDYTLGILPGHSPLISTLIISQIVIKDGENKRFYSIGGGVVKVENDIVTLLVDSIESADEIDIERAKAAKERAEKRLMEISENASIDKKRARLALARAMNRIKLIESNNRH